MGRRYSPEHDDPEQNVEDYLADRQNTPEPEQKQDTALEDWKLNYHLYEDELNAILDQHKSEISNLLPEPEPEEIEAEKELEAEGLPILWFREDFRELVIVKLATKK